MGVVPYTAAVCELLSVKWNCTQAWFPWVLSAFLLCKWPQWHESEAFWKRKIDHVGLLLEKSQQGGVFPKERRVQFSEVMPLNQHHNGQTSADPRQHWKWAETIQRSLIFLLRFFFSVCHPSRRRQLPRSLLQLLGLMRPSCGSSRTLSVDNLVLGWHLR